MRVVKLNAEHPNPLAYECTECEKRWATPTTAQDCCVTDWLGYD